MPNEKADLMSDRLIYETEDLFFYAIETTNGRYPSDEFIQGLTPENFRAFHVAARILTTSISIGRPPSGRSERVRGSGMGLYELRITPRGHRGAQARLLFIREGNSIRCATGLLKRERLSRQDIRLAERIIREDAERSRKTSKGAAHTSGQ